MFVYDSHVPGEALGEREYLFDEATLRQWLALYPEDEDGDRMPAGMMAVVSMRAYSDILKPRPPGNVHAAQTFTLLSPPRLGSVLTTRFSCRAKELKRERRWVWLHSETVHPDGSVAFTGDMGVIWAA